MDKYELLKKELTEYLQHRIDCCKSYLADLHTSYSPDTSYYIDLANTELKVLEEVLHEFSD